MTVQTPPTTGSNAAPAYRIGWMLALPYPVRNMLRRWRGMLGMMVGVGIALGLGMTMLAVSKASNDLFTKDYLESGADIYAVTEGGSLIALLPGDSPGTIDNARRTITRIRGIPGVQHTLGFMAWSLERDSGGRRETDRPAELLLTMGVDGDPSRQSEGRAAGLPGVRVEHHELHDNPPQFAHAISYPKAARRHPHQSHRCGAGAHCHCAGSGADAARQRAATNPYPHPAPIRPSGAR